MTALMDFFFGSFLAPVYFAFLGLIPIVIVLYLLKLRRTPVVISSTLLWRKSLQDLTANAPFQRLRRNLLLLLQILVLLAVVLALARPFVRAEGISGNNVCVLVDCSASMQTIENDGRTRLEIARDAVARMVDDMAGGDKMMLATFADSAGVLCELTGDKRRLREALRSIEAVDTATRIRDGVLLAASFSGASKEFRDTVLVDDALRSTRPSLRTIVVSDGKIGDLDAIGNRAFDVSYLRIGETKNNAGIVAFSVREPGEGQGDRQCLALVANDSDDPLDTTLTLYLDDESLAVGEVKAEPRDVCEVLFTLPPLESGVLRAVLDREDALAVDNQAWLVNRPASKIKVLIVSENEAAGAFFLKRAFSLDARVDLETMTPDHYATATAGDPASAMPWDLFVFNGVAPMAIPAGTSIYINAIPMIDGLVSEGDFANPPIVATDPDHPTMRFLNPANVSIAKARKLALPAGARTLVSTQGAPLIADVSRGGAQILVTAFDIADSDWPLHLSFPLFAQNLVSWAPRAAVAGEMSTLAGSPLTLLPDPDAAQSVVRMPGGGEASVPLDPLRPVFFANTKRAGVYEVATGQRKEAYAVNLLDPLETDIAPAESLAVGRSQVQGEAGRVRQNRELWRWFLLGALGILTLEWWIYSRRAWM